MSLPAIPPEGGEWLRREHFGYVGTVPGREWHAYIAGPAYFLFCHQPKKTKPCIAILTGRAVECPWCSPDFPIVRRGYVPLYRQADNKPCCVIVSDLWEDECKGFRLHDRVMIGKESEDSDPVWIKKALSPRPMFQTTLRCRFSEIDLDETLLRLWGHAGLKSWYDARQKNVSDKPVSLPPGKAVTEKGQEVSPMLQAAAKRAGFPVIAPPGPGASEDEEREYLEQLQATAKPSRNGNGRHKPPPKG